MPALYHRQKAGCGSMPFVKKHTIISPSNDFLGDTSCCANGKKCPPGTGRSLALSYGIAIGQECAHQSGIAP
jgi:hypothetical protein